MAELQRLKQNEKPVIGQLYRVMESFHEGEEGVCASFEEGAFGAIWVTLVVEVGPNLSKGIQKRHTDLAPL